MAGMPRFDFYSRDWIVGTEGLSLEASGAYIQLLARMYDEARPLPFDLPFLARRIGVHWRSLKKAIAELIERGKIIIRNGFLTNDRFEIEMNRWRFQVGKATRAADARASRSPEPSAGAATAAFAGAPEASLDGSCGTLEASLDGSWSIPERFLDGLTPPQDSSNSLNSLGSDSPSRARARASARPRTPSPSPSPSPEVKKEGSLREPNARARAPLADRMAWDTFWHAYPHKVGIAAARKAFPAAIAKAPINEIIAGLERYRSDKPPDRAWCNPSTFLNQERWRDEPADNASRSGSNGHDRRHTGPATAIFEGAARALARLEKRDAEQAADRGADIDPAVPLLDRR